MVCALMAQNHLITLAEVATWTDILDVTCSRCNRRGGLSLGRPVAQHGPGTALRHAVAGLNPDCPNRQAHQINDRCDVFFPGLADLLGFGGS